jgi:hypothetical protein
MIKIYKKYVITNGFQLISIKYPNRLWHMVYCNKRTKLR